jgi:hypothetical protein
MHDVNQDKLVFLASSPLVHFRKSINRINIESFLSKKIVWRSSS